MATVQSLHTATAFVIYPGEQDYALDERLEVLALRHVARLAKAGDLPGSSGSKTHQ